MHAAAPPAEQELLAELHRAVAAAPARPREIEVGIALSIALGRQRPAVACGGCQTPLEFEGIPARTNAQLRAPFRLVYDGPSAR
ncbi:MAG TPA: hypothetical protein VMG99_02680 [Thermoplasmata archaeon]|jgi:hypothetical protein|nr:hypothetical protein [Thermoplasmata archaeon]